jgi:hypothetical protein
MGLYDPYRGGVAPRTPSRDLTKRGASLRPGLRYAPSVNQKRKCIWSFGHKVHSMNTVDAPGLLHLANLPWTFRGHTRGTNSNILSGFLKTIGS